MNTLMELENAHHFHQLIDYLLRNYHIAPARPEVPVVTTLFQNFLVENPHLNSRLFPYGNYNFDSSSGPSSPVQNGPSGSPTRDVCGPTDMFGNRMRLTGIEKPSTRITWTPQLQKIFLAAYEELGPSASAKPVLTLMKEKDVGGQITLHLQRSHVSSHLQKHKKQEQLKRISNTSATPAASSSPANPTTNPSSSLDLKQELSESQPQQLPLQRSTATWDLPDPSFFSPRNENTDFVQSLFSDN